MDGTLLWVYEGMTQFWGTVLPVRAGLIPQPSYREMLASVAGSFDIQTGNRWRPLGDTAVAAQVLYDAPLTWSMSRRDVDFYEASEFLWLNVDTELRTRSGGKVSLDDYVRRFYAGAGGAPALKPFVEPDIYATLAGMVPGGLARDHSPAPGLARPAGAARGAARQRLAAELLGREERLPRDPAAAPQGDQPRVVARAAAWTTRRWSWRPSRTAPRRAPGSARA